MNDCIIKYCLEYFGSGLVAKYKNDIVYFWESLSNDDFFQYDSLNLTKLYKAFQKYGDKTVFDYCYFKVEKNELTIMNDDKYEYVMELIFDSLEKEEKRSV